MKKIVSVGLFVMMVFLIAGCGKSEKKQGTEIADAVFEYAKEKESSGGMVFSKDTSNIKIYINSSMYYVSLEKVLKSKDVKPFLSDTLYEVKKNKEGKYSKTDVKEINERDVDLNSMKIFYEEKNVELVKD